MSAAGDDDRRRFCAEEHEEAAVETVACPRQNRKAEVTSRVRDDESGTLE